MEKDRKLMKMSMFPWYAATQDFNQYLNYFLAQKLTKAHLLQSNSTV